MAKFIDLDAPHFRKLGQVLQQLIEDPHAGKKLRPDLRNPYYVVLGSYWLFYVVDDERMKVRVFDVERILFGW